MTDLTEQWKKGELPNGMYYIELKDGDIVKDVYAFGSWGNINEHFLKQVLAPVPSYEQWKATEERSLLVPEFDNEIDELNDTIDELVEENTQLKRKRRAAILERFTKG